MQTNPVSFTEFKRHASYGRYMPILKRIDYFEDPFQIYRAFREEGSPSVLLESARVAEKTGRYSFIAKNPFLTLKANDSLITLDTFGESETLRVEPFSLIDQILRQFSVEPREEFPPFVGGAIGYFGYEAKNYLEPTLSRRSKENLGLPDVYLLFFDEGLVLDHEARSLYFFVNVKAGRDLARSYHYGFDKLTRLEQDLKKKLNLKKRLPREYFSNTSNRGRSLSEKKRRFSPLLESSLSASEFIEKVSHIQRDIREGEIFQANLSQRFSFELDQDPLDVYKKLKTLNPSPFFGFLDAVDFKILSGSPERLLKLEDGRLETRPIAGTRARGKDEKEDTKLSMDLILNPKERAEHIMLVDLERNDLGRVAEYGSVSVDEMMVLENYSHVKHIVSNIRGTLRRGFSAVDAFKAFFPGGTITGTPKIRCMEILDELEPVERGPYTGSLGYFSFTGNMDFNIIIRSLIIKDNTAYCHAGAGIVADSIPQKEYEETLYKAEGVLSAVFGKKETRAFLSKRGAASRIS